MGAKIKIRKLRGEWYVFLPGDMPEFPRYRFWTDALARVQMELAHRWKAENGPRLVKAGKEGH